MKDNLSNMPFSSSITEEQIVEESRRFQNMMIEKNYTYNFSWLGRPIMQLPQDLYLLQEVFWSVKPNLVIETGIAHGGSLIYMASLLSVLESCNVIEDPIIVGIDIDFREHNRKALEEHPLNRKILTFQGSSIDPKIVSQVKDLCDSNRRVLVILDSNHTKDHVYQELLKYSPLVSVGSYCLVADTGIEFTPNHLIGNRPWGPGNSPLNAVNQFLEENTHFEMDEQFQRKLWITAYFNGALKRVEKG